MGVSRVVMTIDILVIAISVGVMRLFRLVAVVAGVTTLVGVVVVPGLVVVAWFLAVIIPTRITAVGLLGFQMLCGTGCGRFLWAIVKGGRGHSPGVAERAGAA